MEHIAARFVYGDDIYISEEHMDEEWAFISGHPSYKISNRGRVWSDISRKFMTPTPNTKSGHLEISLKDTGSRERAYIHRLVAESFVPNTDNQPVVRHLDDDPENNHVKNLAWGTQADNVRDMYENGEGSNRRITLKNSSGKIERFDSHTQAARALGVSKSAISLLKSGKNKTCKGRILLEVSYD